MNQSTSIDRLKPVLITSMVNTSIDRFFGNPAPSTVFLLDFGNVVTGWF